MKSRFSAIILLIALPVLAFCALGVYFLVDKTPKIINAEKASITREYRDQAESMITNGVTGVKAVKRERGWRQKGARIDKRFPWGWEPRGDGRILIWVEREDKSVIGFERDAIVDSTAFWLYGGGSFAMFFVVVVAVAGIVLLLRYDRERESFLAGMIHDLNNPLVAIRGLVRSDPDYVVGIANSMLSIIRNAQDYLGLGRRRDLEITTFDLVPVIRDAYRMFEDCFTEDESGPVTFDLPDSLFISSDLQETRQILWNLFSNAAKYVAPYGPLAVSASVRGTSAAVEFADQGIGMTARQMRRAFGRFYRAAGLHECGKGGFGIGLYTSRVAARRMGGDLTVRANTPKGCVFTFVLKRLEKGLEIRE